MDLLYVNNNDTGNNTVSALEVVSGALVPLPGSPYQTGGQGLAGLNFGEHTIAYAKHGQSQNQLLFVANQGDGTISTFRVNANGRLTSVGSPVSAGRGYVGSLLAHGYLYAAGDGLSVFTIGRTGTLTPVAAPLFSATLVNALAVSPDGAFLYTSNLWQREVVGYYLYTPSGLPVGGARFSTGSAMPPGLAFQKTGTREFPAFLFVGSAYATATTIGVFLMHRTGALIPLPGSPFTWPSGNGAGWLTLSQNGGLSFVGNNVSRTVTALANTLDVDQTGQVTGQLVLVAGSPFAVASNHSGELSAIVRATQRRLLFAGNSMFDVGAFQIRTLSLSPVSGSPFATGDTHVPHYQSGMVFVRT
jgi:hypothetical protein